MSSLNHWHRTSPEESSAIGAPPDCCRSHFEKVLEGTAREAERQHTETLRAERKRLILAAVSTVTDYGNAAASVLDDTQAQLVLKITEHAIRAVRRTACICPQLDVTSFGQVGKTVRGFDPHCGMHDPDGDY